MSKPFHDFLMSCALLLGGKPNHKFSFDWLTSCPDYKLALNCAGSPKRFSSQDL
jgi:hypothetical protein